MGYIYFVREERNNLFKIGLTRGNKDSRINGLQTGNARPLLLHGYLKCEDSEVVKKESAIHYEFSPYRVKNEWFEVREDLMNKYIISNGGVICEEDFVLPLKDDKFYVMSSQEIEKKFKVLLVFWGVSAGSFIYLIVALIRLIIYGYAH